MRFARVGTCRPQMTGGWLCLLVCGCQVFVDQKRRPREIEGHVCNEDSLETADAEPEVSSTVALEQLRLPGLE